MITESFTALTNSFTFCYKKMTFSQPLIARLTVVAKIFSIEAIPENK